MIAIHTFVLPRAAPVLPAIRSFGECRSQSCQLDVDSRSTVLRMASTMYPTSEGWVTVKRFSIWVAPSDTGNSSRSGADQKNTRMRGKVQKCDWTQSSPLLCRLGESITSTGAWLILPYTMAFGRIGNRSARRFLW